MAERTTDKQHARHPSLGRRLAVGIMGIAIIYLVIVAFASVVPQVFWPEVGEIEPTWSCVDGLTELRDQLLEHSSASIGSAATGDSPTPHREFLDRWDGQYLALESRCRGQESHRESWALLGRLRHRAQQTLERFDAEEGTLAQQMNTNLGL